MSFYSSALILFFETHITEFYHRVGSYRDTQHMISEKSSKPVSLTVHLQVFL